MTDKTEAKTTTLNTGNHVDEAVTIRLSVTCASCKRQLWERADLNGESLRTGNFNQRAVYNQEMMTAHLLARTKARTWDRTDSGWRCAHCRAADLDTLAQQQDPKEGDRT